MVQFPFKILIPQRPSYLVSRPRLTELLGSIIERRLITLSAPAGYGKTSLLIDFANDTRVLPICWYTLDEYDQDPWTFLSYLAAAVGRQFPGTTRQTAALLEGESRSSFTAVAATLVREIYDVGRDFMIVVDDWHLVDHVSEINEVVAQLLLHCPNCHLILASRIYPSLPNLMLLAARRQMSGLDEEHLRFTPVEISAVLGAEYHTTVSEKQAERLAEQSNGWITGILLGVQVTGMRGLEPGLPDARAERQIYRFLAEQVLDRQPPDIRRFLLESALLEDLTAESCATVFGRVDAPDVLDTLLRQHLFVTEIKPGVLRYHPLFREFLHEHYRSTEPELYRATARRVADEYARQEHWALAFETYIIAGHMAGARHVTLHGGAQLYASGRLQTIERWFSILPLDELDAPLLCLHARVLLDRGRSHEAQALADLAGARMRPEDEIAVLLLQAQIGRIRGKYERALEITRRVLAADIDPAQRASALRTAAICQHRLGHSEEAFRGFNEALQIERGRGDLYAVAMLQVDLGVCHTNGGALVDAVEHFSHADSHWALIGNTGLRALSLNNKGVLLHQLGHHREALTTLENALECARDASVTTYQAMALVSLGDLYVDLEVWSEAEQAYAEARRLGGNAYLTNYLPVAGVRLLVRQRQYEAAVAALRRCADAVAEQHPIEMLLLRGSIACGLQRPAEAQDALACIEQMGLQARSPLESARARLIQAQILVTTRPEAPALMIAALQDASNLSEESNSDAALVADALPLGQLLRHAVAAGWSQASDWLRRHQELRRIGQTLMRVPGRPELIVHVLGSDGIVLDDKPVDIGWLKAREVLHYLLAHPRGASAEVVREAIWPDLSLDSSRNALKTAIHQLRARLPRDLILTQGRMLYLLNRDVVDLSYDLEQFLALLDRQPANLDTLERALDLYKGPYLVWSDSVWSDDIRTLVAQRFHNALRTAAELYEQEGLYLDALSMYQRLLVVDDLDEAAHTGVMRCQVRLGNRAAAIGQYQELRRVLDHQLGLDPGRSSEAERIYIELLALS